MLIVLALQGCESAAAIENQRRFFFQFVEIFRLHAGGLLVRLHGIQALGAILLQIGEILLNVLLTHDCLPCQKR